jgi:hypothetical protein
LFSEAEESERMNLRGPNLDEVVEVLEVAAGRAGRTWNKQLSYVVGVCMGDQLPDADDTLTAHPTWEPFAAIYPRHRRQGAHVTP